jgi:hypothetical protein
MGLTLDMADIEIVYFLGAVALALIISLIANIIINRSNTRPLVQPFYGGAVTGSSNLSCGRMSSEAEQLYSTFLISSIKQSETGKDNLRELKMLLSKLCCFKQDLMAPQQTITAVKELGFVTQQDIQPIGDLTGRCFSKTIPERDLGLQIIKWRDSGRALIHRLCTDANLSEGQVRRAENLFTTLISDVEDVSRTQCLGSLPKAEGGRFDPEAVITKNVSELKKYDGLY